MINILPLNLIIFSLFSSDQSRLDGQHSPPTQAEPDDQLADIVVTARRLPSSSQLGIVDYYKRYCFDANRLTGKSAPPVEDADWQPLDEKTRGKFGIVNPSVPAFGLVDPVQNTTFLIKFENFERPGNLTENRCTFLVIGGSKHDSLPNQLSTLFRGPPTQRQVGHPDGTKKIKGWRQWLWTGMPARKSKSWQTIDAEVRNSSGGTWVVVTDLSFYQDHDYILGELKTRQGDGVALSVISFAYITQRNK